MDLTCVDELLLFQAVMKYDLADMYAHVRGIVWREKKSENIKGKEKKDID